jgi:hypothetical protein
MSAKRGSTASRASIQSTGGLEPASPSGPDAARSAARGASGRAASAGRRRSFGGTSKREMHLELLGEGTPGPGAYAMTSTFGRASSSSSLSLSAKLNGRKPITTTSSFRSTSAQRIRSLNERVPGPGAHTPNMGAIEKNATNSAPHLQALGTRFVAQGDSGVSDWVHSRKPEPGPGAYETQKYQTMAMDMVAAVAAGSRQNPGFGIASPQHQLPHETAVSNDAELPGPGKYETNKSVVALADGHSSAFKPPTQRKKQHGFRDTSPSVSKGNGKKGKGNRSSQRPSAPKPPAKAPGAAASDTVHV